MRSMFLSLVLGVAALGIFAMPSSADAHPARAYVNCYHPPTAYRHSHYRYWYGHHDWHRNPCRR
jgi:hypothetical protein